MCNTHFPINSTFLHQYTSIDRFFVCFKWLEMKTKSAIYWIGYAERVWDSLHSILVSNQHHHHQHHVVTSVKLVATSELNKKQLDLQVFHIHSENIVVSGQEQATTNRQRNSKSIKINSWLILILQLIYWLYFQGVWVSRFEVLVAQIENKL